MNLTREIITPTDEAHWLTLRAGNLNSTDVAALFGLSPYKTAFELWHEKRAGEVVKIADNDRMKWGRRLEATVAQGIADDQGWAVQPFKDYMRLPDVRIGASFDFRVLAKFEQLREGMRWHLTGDDAILEIKTVDFLAFRDGWTIDEGFVEAPAHIEIQVQHQMLVSGLHRAYIGVMVGGNRIEVLERLADDAVHAGILAKAAEFWRSIEADMPPTPVMPDDAAAVIRLNAFAEPGKLLDARGDTALATLLTEYKRLKSEARDCDEMADVRKAEILQLIGDAEKVISDVGTVSAGIVGPTRVEYDRARYRNFRFTPKKSTTKAQEAAQ